MVKINLESKPWEQLTPEEKKIQLYLKQKETLDSFLSSHAITRARYDKSLGDLTQKMGMENVLKELQNGK